jgi:hypothetical protein
MDFSTEQLFLCFFVPAFNQNYRIKQVAKARRNNKNNSFMHSVNK